LPVAVAALLAIAFYFGSNFGKSNEEALETPLVANMPTDAKQIAQTHQSRTANLYNISATDMSSSFNPQLGLYKDLDSYDVCINAFQKQFGTVELEKLEGIILKGIMTFQYINGDAKQYEFNKLVSTEKDGQGNMQGMVLYRELGSKSSARLNNQLKGSKVDEGGGVKQL